ncbi:MAG: hypothetical protein BroJett020_00670 [Bacteroidota bacterium]|nr:T9SS type A sorting domain-containing protein [Flavobacteriales bacterium]GIK68772.1 MAG: hypothetical protein BroJett020_00670 [Bacteroidota bacterium]
MKKNLSIVILIIFSNITFSQNVLFDNHTFELGNFKSDCNYGVSVFDIDNYISNWRVAKHEINMGNGFSPFWLDISESVCNNYRFVCGWYYGSTGGYSSGNANIQTSNRFLYLKQYALKYKEEKEKYKKSYHNAIYNTFDATLPPGKFYNVRFKYIAYSTYNVDQSSGKNHLRFFISSESKKWYKGNSQVMELVNSNIIEQKAYQEGCNWKQKQSIIYVPNGLNNINYFIIYAEEGQFGLDDIEFYEYCPSTMVIENRTFDNYFYSSQSQNGQTFIYEATDYLYAGNGNWQNTPELIVEKGADMVFRAGQGVDLLPGFTAENNVDVYIAPCGSGNRIAQDTTGNSYFSQLISEEDENDDLFLLDITIYPNPSTGLFTIESQELINLQQIELYDIFGKCLQPVINQNGNALSLNLTGYAKGMYFIKIGTYSQKIAVE